MAYGGGNVVAGGAAVAWPVAPYSPVQWQVSTHPFVPLFPVGLGRRRWCENPPPFSPLPFPVPPKPAIRAAAVARVPWQRQLAVVSPLAIRELSPFNSFPGTIFRSGLGATGSRCEKQSSRVGLPVPRFAPIQNRRVPFAPEEKKIRKLNRSFSQSVARVLFFPSVDRL